MGDELPTEFDVVILGTGLPESILAAACSRAEKTVLHIDRNEYYGGLWASFNLEAFESWIEERKKEGEDEKETPDWTSIPLSPEEAILPLHYLSPITHLNHQWHATSLPVKDNLPENDVKTEDTTDSEVKEKISTENAASSPENDDEASNKPSNSFEAGDSQTEKKETEQGTPVTPPEKVEQEWTQEKVKKDWRKFSLDLTPKILCSRGPMVELLIRSGVGRYVDFKCVDRFLCSVDGQLKTVPCSRADVFQSQDVTMIEKRKLMKFLTFCLNYKPEDTLENSCEIFRDYLEACDLTPLLRHYIFHALALASDATTTPEGLTSAKKFLMSVGRFGNSPFLWTMYGSGELPQCFCRLCAVFGGTYCLRKPVDGIVIIDNRCVAVIIDGQRITCGQLICDQSYLVQKLDSKIPKPQLSESHNYFVQRAILVTDKSIKEDEKKESVTMLNMEVEGAETSVRILEVGSSSMICPKPMRVIHMTSKGMKECKPKLEKLADKLFNTHFESTENCDKPLLLWSLYFSYPSSSAFEPEKHIENVTYTLWPDDTVDYESAIEKVLNLLFESCHEQAKKNDISCTVLVNQAKETFNKLWPDDEFLPELPPPEEDEVVEEMSGPGINGFTPESKST